MSTEWTPPPPAPPAAVPTTSGRTKRGMLVAAALLGTGTIAGAIIGATALSNAATTSTSPSTGSSSSNYGVAEPGGHRGGGLDLSGTVTAVGASSVTIKTASATATYTVNTSSDIDKNGEAKLSDLKAGDAVTFSVDSTGKTIDKLHAGNESLDRPQGAPSGAPNNNVQGGVPSGSGTTGG